LSRQFGGRHPEFLKFVGKMFAGMNRGAGHLCFLSDLWLRFAKLAS
jgi:hypothetical protein